MKATKTSAKAAKAMKEKKAPAMKEKKAAAMKATKAMKEKKAAAMKEKKAAAMKATKAMKVVMAEQPMSPRKIHKKSWGALHRGKYYEWQLKSIVRKGDQINEVWAGKLLPAADRG